jgi:hypothetical protein
MESGKNLFFSVVSLVNLVRVSAQGSNYKENVRLKILFESLWVVRAWKNLTALCDGQSLLCKFILVLVNIHWTPHPPVKSRK